MYIILTNAFLCIKQKAEFWPFFTWNWGLKLSKLYKNIVLAC